MYLARNDERAPGKTVVYHADNLSKYQMFYFLFLKFIYLISAMKNINIIHKITGRIGDLHDSHLSLLKFAQCFMALTQD